MADDKAATLVVNALKRHPYATALELWQLISRLAETNADKALLRQAFRQQDQSIRVLLARLANTGAVCSRIRATSGVLLEWWAV